MDVIIATASQLPRPDEDDAPLRAALGAEGLMAETRAWDDPGVDWSCARACCRSQKRRCLTATPTGVAAV